MLARLRAVLGRLEDGLAGVLMLLLVAVSSLQILRRLLFHDGWTESEAAARALVLWIGLVGAVAATRERRHVRIDLLARRLPAWGRRIAEGLAAAFTAGICAVMAWQGWQLVQLERAFPEPAFAGLPGWWITLILPAGFAVMALRFLLEALGRLMPATGGRA